MKTCGQIAAWFDRKWPEALACSWDNVGLLAGRADKEVHTVYVALDATEQTIEAAIRARADMLLTHHPLIFGGVKQVSDKDALGRRLLSLIRADISCYSGHTSFDIARGGMADLAAGQFGFFDESRELCPLEVTGEQDGALVGIGKVGTLKELVDIEELSQIVKERFGIPAVNVCSSKKQIRKAALSPGSGKSMIKAAVSAGADVLITGDMGHHEGLDLVAEGVSLIDAGHYGLEHIFVDAVADELEAEGAGLKVIRAPLAYPYKIL
ncbi:MAG: Nif3-like dinuclear metal center hexameric protein [Lachnospiraceae bacterium]|jgi:dinuclear metal center YbgI/SA1388 family protein|nr:Nif3-like dinuclear metal center hexameric protein [Lachnospiraceae bacterium]